METFSKMELRVGEFAWFNGDPNPNFTHKFQKALPSSEYLHTFDQNLQSWIFGNRLFAQQLANVSGKKSLVTDVGDYNDLDFKTSYLEMLP